METITIELNFHDPAMLKAAGLKFPQPAEMQGLPGALPNAGDVISHAGIHYPSGERAVFRVISRAHLFGGKSLHRVQLNIELLVLHQP